MQNILLRKAILTTTIAALLLGGTAFHRLHADEPQPGFRMACIFTDHMVLQRDQPLPVWGWAAPGRAVTSLAFLEVSAGENTANAYAILFGSETLPFDYVWFTPRVDIRDACERFEEQLKKMRGE